MIAIVTGAGGFLGSKLIMSLIKDGHQVRGVVRMNPPIIPNNVPPLITWIHRDLSKQGLNQEEICDADVVFHLAATKNGSNARNQLLDNEFATINLLESVAGSINKIIFASSQVVYGDVNSICINESFPIDCAATPYATSKANSESWLRFYQHKFNGDYTVLRFTGFIEDGSIINYIFDRAVRHETIELYSCGLVCRDYLTVDDGLQALRLAARSHNSNNIFNIFNIGSGEVISTYELAKTICQETGSKSVINLIDKSAPKQNFIYDISKAKFELGFSPAPIETSVKKYVQDKLKDMDKL